MRGTDVSIALGPYVAALSLLGVAGVTKVARPDGTARALGLMGLDVPPVAVRAAAAVQGVFAAAGAVVGTGARWWAAAAGVSYAVFAVFTGVAVARSVPLSSCGCFGETGAPPGALHVVVDVLLCMSSVGFALLPGAGAPAAQVAAFASGRPALCIALACATAAAAYGSYVALTTAPGKVGSMARAGR